MRRLLCLLALAGCAHEAHPPVLDQLPPLEDRAAPQGNLVLRVDPPDAEVEVDGVVRGQAQDFDGRRGALELSEGRHLLRLSKGGYQAQELTVFASSEGRQTVQAALEKQ